MTMRAERIEPAPGQESVWDYPRPPRLESVALTLRVVDRGITLAETSRGFRLLETSHPPVYYLPPEDVRLDLLRPLSHRSFCEFKGVADYWVQAEGGDQPIAWSYPDPTEAFRPITGFMAFYASRVESCWVGEERVEPQDGDFYGGWITSKVVGPFKGATGTRGW